MSNTDTIYAVVLGAVLLLGGIALGWGVRTALESRRARRRQEFLGLPDGTDCVIVTSAPGNGPGLVAAWPDVYALLELGALVRGCDARPALVTHGRMAQGVGSRTEFCLGGPPANSRSAAHLEWKLPGVTFGPEPAAALTSGKGAGAGALDDPLGSLGAGADSGGEPARPDPVIKVAGKTYRAEHGSSEYVLLAKLNATDVGRPVFLICGQTPVAHHAAVRWFADRQRTLARKYGPEGDFTMLLRVVNSAAYGPDVVELVSDITDAARKPIISGRKGG
jgi:hypothetical protein